MSEVALYDAEQSSPFTQNKNVLMCLPQKARSTAGPRIQTPLALAFGIRGVLMLLIACKVTFGWVLLVWGLRPARPGRARIGMMLLYRAARIARSHWSPINVIMRATTTGLNATGPTSRAEPSVCR